MFGVDFLDILTRSIAIAAFVDPMEASRNGSEGPKRRANPAPRAAGLGGMRSRAATQDRDGWRKGFGG